MQIKDLDWISSSDYRDMWRDRGAGERGRLIVVCGFDGSGKTTQISRIADHLKSQGREVLLTRQPTDWYRENRLVREYLDHGKSIDKKFLALLAAADRRLHIVQTVMPALNNDIDVISDRYIYSSLAYFSARGLSATFISQINKDLPQPDLTFYLDVSPQVVISRLHQRDKGKLKYEERDSEFIEKIMNNFRNLALLDSKFRVLNGDRKREEITAEVIRHLESEQAVCGTRPVTEAE